MPVERLRCTAIILSLLGIGFLVSAIVLINRTDSIIKKAVNKVAHSLSLSCVSTMSLILGLGMSIERRNNSLQTVARDTGAFHHCFLCL